MGGLRLHPAAEIFYHRNDALTSDRLGRLSFVASAIAGLFAAGQFFSRYRRGERVRRRRRLLGEDLAKLRALRVRIDDSPDANAARGLIREADDLLSDAEQDAAMDLLDTEGIQALRSLHQISVRAAERAVGDAHRAALHVWARSHAGAGGRPRARPSTFPDRWILIRLRRHASQIFPASTPASR